MAHFSSEHEGPPKWLIFGSFPSTTRSPSSDLLPTFFGEGSPTKIEKNCALILTSLLEDLNKYGRMGLISGSLRSRKLFWKFNVVEEAFGMRGYSLSGEHTFMRLPEKMISASKRLFAATSTPGFGAWFLAKKLSRLSSPAVIRRFGRKKYRDLITPMELGNTRG